MVDAEHARALRERSPYNIAHVECCPDSADPYYRDYQDAAKALRRWQTEGVLRRDPAPAYYVYEQRFSVHGEIHTRRCFFARLRLHPPEDGAVRPHEATMPGPVEDRLQLLRATVTNVSPIFAMFDDDGGTARAILDQLASTRPLFEASDDRGDRHRLWMVDDAAQLAALTGAVEASVVTIADGHHRYTTALDYSREQPSEAARWVLAGLIALDDPGLMILPNHRLVKADRQPHDLLERLSELYLTEDVTPPPSAGGGAHDGAAVRELWDRVQANARGAISFGALGIQSHSLHLLTARSAEAIDAAMPARLSRASRSLDVSILTETVLRPLLGIDTAALAAGERVDFTEEIEVASNQTEGGSFRLAFLVNPVRVEQVTAVADASELMPQKTTFFYPKLHTGMVFNPLD